MNSWSIAVDAGCDDANACTLFDRCDATGACAGTGVISCPQAPCHEYAACNPASGLCDETAPLPDGMCCDDAHYCLGGVCTHACNIDGGVVPAGGFKPGNPCRRCDPEIDATAWAVLDGVPCDDGDACSSSSVCAAGSCLALDVVTCVALDACHLAGVCDPVSGECSNPVADAGTPCSDGFACTVNDVCADGACAGDGSGCACAKAADCPLPPPCQALSGCVDHQCRYVNDDAASCSDGDGCTTGDHCAAGACVARGEVPCMRDEACVAFTCDASTGACVTHHLDDGTGCDGGACLRGACVPPDAGTPDGGVDGLAPVHFVASGCGTGGSFLLGAIGLFLCLRRRF